MSCASRPNKISAVSRTKGPGQNAHWLRPCFGGRSEPGPPTRPALAAVGYDQLVEEIESGVRARNRLTSLLSRLAPRDELIVKSLDRLGRRAGELVILLDEQHRRGVNVRILDMPWLDYSAPIGRFIAQMFAALAELEREQTRERQRGGIDAAKRAGRPS